MQMPIRVFWLSFIWIASSTIFGSNYIQKCYGNSQLIDGKCVTCQYGSVALNGKCVKLDLGFTYGSSSVASNNDDNCEFKRYFFGVCLRCNSGYYLDQNSKCKDIKYCLHYSYQQQKCLTEQQFLKQFQKLLKQNQQIKQHQANGNKTNQQIQVLSEQQKKKATHASYIYQAILMQPLNNIDIPVVFLPNSQISISIKSNQADSNSSVQPYKIHEQYEQSDKIASTNKTTIQCQKNQIYNKLLKQCIKTSTQNLYIEKWLGKQLQIVDPNCKIWVQNTQAQDKQQQLSYRCQQCKELYVYSIEKKKCLYKQQKQSIVFIIIDKNCLEVDKAGKCIRCGNGYQINNGNCIK